MEEGGVGNYGNKIMKIQQYTKSDMIKMKFTVYALALYFFHLLECLSLTKKSLKVKQTIII
jgi:hypothetical protein